MCVFRRSARSCSSPPVSAVQAAAVLAQTPQFPPSSSLSLVCWPGTADILLSALQNMQSSEGVDGQSRKARAAVPPARSVLLTLVRIAIVFSSPLHCLVSLLCSLCL